MRYGLVARSGILNPYSNPRVLNAQKLQYHSVAHLVNDHPAVGLWTLGYESDLFTRPKNDRIGEKWSSDLACVIHEIDPIHPMICGL